MPLLRGAEAPRPQTEGKSPGILKPKAIIGNPFAKQGDSFPWRDFGGRASSPSLRSGFLHLRTGGVYPRPLISQRQKPPELFAIVPSVVSQGRFANRPYIPPALSASLPHGTGHDDRRLGRKVASAGRYVSLQLSPFSFSLMYIL